MDELTSSASAVVARPRRLPLDASRLRVPFMRPGVVERETVVERLEAEEPWSQLSVVAPAGYGKTTLVHQWVSSHRRAVAWLSLDAEDNDPTVFLTYLAAALDGVVALDQDVFSELAVQYPSTDHVGRLVASSLSRADDPFVLVLDDLHTLANPVCLDVVDRLLRAASPTARVALASRRMPGGSIPRLRASGSLVDVGPVDLAMASDEAVQLWSGSGLVLSHGDADALVETTEGWPVALYLAARSAVARGSAAIVERRDLPSRSVVDYIHAELLSSLDSDTVRFLTRSAVLERMSGASCDAVLRTFGSGDRLRAFGRGNLLVVPLDEGGTWYRYHHIFRELLLAELTRREPGMVRELRTRAAQWHHDQGFLDSAVDYAMAIEDVDRAAGIVANHALTLYRDGRLRTLAEWFDWFDRRDAMVQHPAVAVAGAWWAALLGRAALAERWATAAAQARERDHQTVDDALAIDGHIALVQAALCRNGLARALDDIAVAERLFPLDHPWRPGLLLFHGVIQIASGAPASADRILTEAVEVARDFGAGPAQVTALAERSLLALGRDETDEARGLIRRAMEVVEQEHLREHAGTALVLAVAARIHTRDGDRGQARSLLASFDRVRGRLNQAMPLLAVQARVAAMRALLGLTDGPGARTLLREVDEILRLRPDLGFVQASVDDVRDQLDAIPVGAFGASTLTEAELRLLPLLQTHYTFREVGEQLFISANTVKTQAISIYRKLGVTSRSHAVAAAIKIGLLDH